jgi:hypothetical protein
MIRAQIYKVYIAHIQFLRVLYRGKSADKTSNAFVLGIFLIAFNIHSLVVIIELSMNMNIGLIDFWKPSSVPKSGLGYMFGFVFSVIYLTMVQILKNSIPKKIRIQILKEIVVRKKHKTLAILYVIFSVLMFLITIVILVNAIAFE